LFDHPNHTLIDLGNNTGFYLHFLHLLEEGLYEDTQVELDFARFLGGVRVDVLHFYYLRHVFYDLDHAVQRVHLHCVDDLLAEELGQAWIHLVIQFRILSEQRLIIIGKEMNQMLRPSILNRHLNSLLHHPLNLHNIPNPNHRRTTTPQRIKNLLIRLNPHTRIIPPYPIKLLSVNIPGQSEFLLHLGIFSLG
jgi:hypothetical protein